MKGHDLASAAGKELVSAGEPFDHNAALRRPVLVADDILIRLEVAQRDWQRRDCAILGVRDGGRCSRAFGSAARGGRWPLALRRSCMTREHSCLSAIGAPGTAEAG